ncbi:hypothetical protein ZIOFF_007802 [Zingiber officinale]|uniref:Protein FAR1-RELATED SEQUENCE n=1 Tax=Zingiber officinale TaxID=94328 RepID=A0A8J5LT86_ZINOF|nr:hypothetical protein ZIOFF_007802 [Zingiber officinale]
MEQGKSDSNEVNDNNDHVSTDLSPSSLNEVMIPKIGMTFISEDDVCNFYKSYAQNVGFDISKLGGKKGDDGKQKYFCFGCAKSGKTISQAKNALYPRPTKTNCKAKINIVIQNDDNFVISSVSLEHNHVLSPGKSQHYRCNKLLDSTTKRKLELNDQAGITLSKSFHSLVVEAGGYENLTFDERKCRNYISEARRLRLRDGDVETLSNYFCRMQSRNSNFFYVLDLDEESRIRNVFWADARFRVAYDNFSDVVTFDTTYLTNSYDMSFAPFVGVNHYGQSILLGCGLLSSEDSETFIWLFKSWLTCMLGRALKAIITYQCRAMTIAIEEIFLDSHHRFGIDGYLCTSRISFGQVCPHLKAMKFDNALKKKIEKENNLDFGSFNSMIPVISGYPIERQFQSFYTNNLFKLFQDEIRGLMFCNTSLVRQEGVAFIFEVVETLLRKNGDPIRDASFKACDLCVDRNEGD